MLHLHVTPDALLAASREVALVAMGAAPGCSQRSSPPSATGCGEPAGPPGLLVVKRPAWSRKPPFEPFIERESLMLPDLPAGRLTPILCLVIPRRPNVDDTQAKRSEQELDRPAEADGRRRPPTSAWSVTVKRSESDLDMVGPSADFLHGFFNRDTNVGGQRPPFHNPTKLRRRVRYDQLVTSSR